MAARPYVVALTGGIGSGKTTVASGFAALGIEIVDADVISRRLTVTGGAALPALVAAFGAEILDADGALDRARMRARVFNDDAARKTLESALHPLIGSETQAAISRAASPYVMWVVPLLFEARQSQRTRYERALVVDCSVETQITRVMQRSGLSREEVTAIMAHQVSRAERLAKADDVIVNEGEMTSLEATIEKLNKKYLSLAAGSAIERL